MKTSFLPLLTLGLSTISPALALELTFDLARYNPQHGETTPMNLPPGYGDNIDSYSLVYGAQTWLYGDDGRGLAPHITTEFLPGANQTVMRAHHAGLQEALARFGPSSAIEDQGLYIHFTAEPGYQVRLHGFDIANYSLNTTLNRLQVFDHNGLALYDQSNLLVQGGTASSYTSFLFDIPFTGSELTIRLAGTYDSNLSYPNTSSFAIDNIAISEIAASVPDQTNTATALAVTLAAVILFRRT